MMEKIERFLVTSDPPVFARIGVEHYARMSFGGSVGNCVSGNRYTDPDDVLVDREWFQESKMLPVDWAHWKVVEQQFDDGATMEEIAAHFVRDKVLDRESEYMQTDAGRLLSSLNEALRLAEMNADGSLGELRHSLRRKLRRMIHSLEGSGK
jgi:hypothetical protein